MNDSPLDRGIATTPTRDGGAQRARRSIPIGAAFRIAAALALCAACYQAGRWHGSLEAEAARPPQRTAAAAPAARGPAAVEPAAAVAAPGKAVGGPELDVITPLNVRDPSALVMPPFATEQVAASVPPPAPPAEPKLDEAPPSPPARVFPRPDAKVQPPRRF